ncbi:MAG: hypothetical protein H7A37_04930 [Chlamydiales bacterium]|nr:hypothetical protein [Chlamydiia bacterium]MCP5507626.1 hypothetical protein [Chlamydiales bacterium]
MKKWKSNLTKAAVSLCLLAAAPNLAQAGSCDPCDPCANPCDMCCFGGFDIGADFLWWKPCVDSLDWVAERSSSTSGGTTTVAVDYKNVCPKWEPGFRVWIGKDDLICDCDFSFYASYTWINTKENETATATDSNTLVSTLLHSGFSTSDSFTSGSTAWDTTYQTFDVLMAHKCCCGDCFEFVPFFGVEGLFINQSFNTTLHNSAETIVGTTHFDSDYSGVGLKAGTGYEWQVTDCIRLFSKASGSIVVGDQDGKGTYTYTASSTTTEVVYADSDCCEIVPGYHVAAGFVYDTCMCGMDMSFHIGYEFLKWYNVTNPRVFVGDNTTSEVALSTSPTTTTFGWHGLMVGMDLSF